MNMAEALSREVERVTGLRSVYHRLGNDVPQAATGPAIMMMTMALEQAHIAAGTGDVLSIIGAYEQLKGFKE
jgi:hypothetical protein